MKSRWYKSAKGTIGGHKAIQLETKYGDDMEDLALVGKYGEIWMVNPHTCAALITSPRIAKKYLDEDKHPVVKGDEIRFTFPLSELETWIKRLKITGNRNGMIRMSNFFGEE